MNVLIVSDLFPPEILGGAEVSTALLAQSMADEGHKVIVLTTSKDVKKIVQANGNLTIVSITPIFKACSPYARSRTTIQKIIWQLSRLFDPIALNGVNEVSKICAFDLILTSNISFFSAKIWKYLGALKVPVIHIVRDYYLVCSRGTVTRQGKSCDRKCVECVVTRKLRNINTRCVDHFVFISDYLQRTHLELVPKIGQKSSRIYVSVQTPHVPDQTPRVDYKIRPRSTVNFGVISRLSPEKGIHNIISAFREAGKLDDTLLIAGAFSTAAYEEECKRLSQDLRVDFVGKVNPELFFQRIDIHVSVPTWPEPLSRTPIEAAMFGVISLVSSVGGQQEIIEHLECGLACRPEVQSIISGLDKIRSVVYEPEDLIRAAKNTFSPTIITAQYRTLFEHIIGKLQ